MASKSDFTSEEWDQLLQFPFQVGLYVIMADLSIVGMIREMGNLFKSINDQPIPEQVQELVGSLVADIQSSLENIEQLPVSEAISQDKPGDAMESLLESIKANVILVDTIATSDEAASFMEWLMNVAKAVSEAAREGGFMGMGGEIVSDKEMAALKDLKLTLRM